MADSGQLEKFGMTDLEVFHALDRLNVRDVDYADLYFESRVSESVSMEEGIVKRASKSISQGVGVRATAGPVHHDVSSNQLVASPGVDHDGNDHDVA